MTGFQSKKASSDVRWLGPYAPTDRHADDVTLAGLVKLRKQNEIMKEALREIAKSQPSGCEQAFKFKMLARSALREGE